MSPPPPCDRVPAGPSAFPLLSTFLAYSVPGTGLPGLCLQGSHAFWLLSASQSGVRMKPGVCAPRSVSGTVGWHPRHPPGLLGVTTAIPEDWSCSAPCSARWAVSFPPSELCPSPDFGLSVTLECGKQDPFHRLLRILLRIKIRK